MGDYCSWFASRSTDTRSQFPALGALFVAPSRSSKARVVRRGGVSDNEWVRVEGRVQASKRVCVAKAWTTSEGMY